MERGRPPTISQDTGERIRLIARMVPAEWGHHRQVDLGPENPASHLADRKVIASMSREHQRRILPRAGVSWQTTTPWKSSNDRDFIAKTQRVLDLYDHPPPDGRGAASMSSGR
ncbi:hypothetical protein [Streptomyces sp. SID12488]|uniref:hypothetical protein n=1 Tax=Streptomyces sp. SID12488 TaxID=2706040 RepID=UPI0013DB0C1D|nr:hypothetical protein [Streptomyces sp. SID12488]NEA63498.1 hypothetical protein [Streptomyces sp. SID12488]